MKKTIILISLLLLIGAAYAFLILTLKDSSLPLYALILGIAMLATISIMKAAALMKKKRQNTACQPASQRKKKRKNKK